MAWGFLLIAGIFEMLGVTFINTFHQKQTILALVLLITSFAGSFFFLAFAMEDLPMGTAYPIWTGIGASGGALLGMLLYGESKDWKRLFFIALILSATIGLKMIS